MDEGEDLALLDRVVDLVRVIEVVPARSLCIYAATCVSRGRLLRLKHATHLLHLVNVLNYRLRLQTGCDRRNLTLTFRLIHSDSR